MNAQQNRIVLNNARIFTNNTLILGHLIIEGNKIQSIHEGSFSNLGNEQNDQDNSNNIKIKIFDLENALVLPGFIDMHVHFRDFEQSSKETLETGSKGALFGGVTTVITMPNTNPPLSSLKSIESFQKKLNNTPIYCNIGIYSGIKQDFNPSELPVMKKKGIFGVKVYPGDFSDNLPLKWEDGWRSDMYPGEFTQKISQILDNFQQKYDYWRQLFKLCKENNVPILFHPELPRDQKSLKKIYEQGLKIAEIENSPNSHLFAHHVSHPVYTNELGFVEMIIAFLYQFFPEPKDAPHVHFVHVSSAEVIEVIQEMLKKKEYPCSIEVSPHHLLLNYDMKFPSENYAKVLVPLRSPEIQQQLKKEWQSGKADVIGTDHAPHTYKEKSQDFFSIPSGFPSIDFASRILLSQVFQGEISLAQLVEMYSTHPAKLLNLPHKGKIAPDMDADLIVVHQTEPYRLNHTRMKSKQKWTPWESYQVSAEIDYVFLGGKLAFERNSGIFTPFGTFLNRDSEL
ncbi:MAG: dihydroorotase family protein [Candidatus Lokiarchaeota archaeon]|nr:dihydroorotase family protein [Candidatus Harpocratesius repetitus]